MGSLDTRIGLHTRQVYLNLHKDAGQWRLLIDMVPVQEFYHSK